MADSMIKVGERTFNLANCSRAQIKRFAKSSNVLPESQRKIKEYVQQVMKRDVCAVLKDWNDSVTLGHARDLIDTNGGNVDMAIKEAAAILTGIPSNQ